ncbi:DsbA family protein [Aurantiacibacter aquimixticola]|uniref:Protein-disulfide isomerase n=1 Tax=Aurantiacibacter aquimixticola TaxID=1958945 RepID=A0A419RQJ2_9SPHN|nr:thioredoxin domain-containing protein [Aurantiacibacter aquimixticola]RJY08036.1 protein-disulfide isomerase [Aurantiacibacter aquimixticola]
MIRMALALLAAIAMPAIPAAAQNWNATFSATDGGGHRVGNPDADTQLIVFSSYTCPHCATFERDSEAELRYFLVHEGRAALEMRHMIRNIVDVAAALATECGPEDKFFANHRTMLASQEDWLARGRDVSPQRQQRWNGGDFGQRMRAIAGDLGWYDIMERRGYLRSELDACLSDRAAADAIVAASQAGAAQYNVPGTPSFVLNGQLIDGVHNWLALRPLLTNLPAETVLEGG